MRDTMKKILGVALAAVSVTSVFAGCKTTKYKGDPIGAEYVSAAEVRSNGGFAVEKGDYVYFINAQEVNSANNKYGEVVKGALMRISKADLAAGKNTASIRVMEKCEMTRLDEVTNIEYRGENHACVWFEKTP